MGVVVLRFDGSTRRLACLGLWSGSMTRRVLLGSALAVPTVFAVVAFSSSDSQALLFVAVLGWFCFWWFLRRPQVAQWIRD
jgi:hypothetical protein